MLKALCSSRFLALNTYLQPTGFFRHLSYTCLTACGWRISNGRCSFDGDDR